MMIKNLTALLAALFVSLMLAESFLRLFPALIPVSLLVDFNPLVSKAVGEQTGLQTTSRFRELPRDDGGPPLLIPLPHTSFVVRASSTDLAFGATERQATDANGMCNPGVPSTTALLALGDSFTWCTQVGAGQTWSARMRGFANVSTYNVSRPGEGIYEYVQMLKQFGLSLHPKIVILAVYEGNDLRDGLEYWQFREKKRDQRPKDRSDLAREGPEWSNMIRLMINQSMFGSTYVANFLGAAALQLEQRQHHDAIDFRYSVLVGGSKLDMNVEDHDLDEVEHASVLKSDPSVLQVWDGALEAFVDLAREHAFFPVVLYIPSAYTAYSKTVTFDDRGTGEAVRQFSKIQRAYLKQQSEHLGYGYVDASPELADLAAGSQQPLYFPASVHLTAAGNAAIAAVLARHLEELWQQARAWRHPAKRPDGEFVAFRAGRAPS